MLLHTLLFLGALQVINAFTIPAGTPNGVYTVSKSPTSGLDQHELISNITDTNHDLRNIQPSTRAQSLPRLLRRDYKTECYSAKSLNPSDLDTANADLDRQCGDGKQATFVPKGRNFYTVPGNTVAYDCNFGGDNLCDAGTRRARSAMITGLCGAYNSGGVISTHSEHAYGYDAASAKFCGTGV
ncbi:hypothetical protein CBER1_08393 [Cercospora berteroae]|uniref:Ecp2 effector protein domain-containing protein n=1 Tax=Cercospora berteroae TaxID=357750 RepID=A0A2S6CG98_9PEZI|nr:hypothetical protein CBER1_08393 [Cercospora berteroae]